MAETFYLIDTNSSMYQAFYGIRRLDDPEGNPVNAAYGIAALLMRLIGRSEAAYVAAAMDPPGKTFRHEKFPAYKATRKEMPSELAGQIPVISNWPLIRPGFYQPSRIGTSEVSCSTTYQSTPIFLASGMTSPNGTAPVPTGIRVPSLVMSLQCRTGMRPRYLSMSSSRSTPAWKAQARSSRAMPRILA